VFICFTLDAGPNVHVLYAQEDESKVLPFIENELLPYCVDRKVIHDRIGFGPKKID
jgi:diphosphomevalonate decarboxylase